MSMFKVFIPQGQQDSPMTVKFDIEESANVYRFTLACQIWPQLLKGRVGLGAPKNSKFGQMCTFSSSRGDKMQWNLAWRSIPHNHSCVPTYTRISEGNWYGSTPDIPKSVKFKVSDP